METRYAVTLRGRTHLVTIREDAGEMFAEMDGLRVPVDLRHVTGTPLWTLVIAHQIHKCVLVKEGDGHSLYLDGSTEKVEIGSERDLILRQFAPAGGKKKSGEIVKSPMPGLVLSVKVAPGDEVKAGQTVVTVEAMKMENEFRTNAAGIVDKVHVKQGDSVAKDAPLVTIKAPAAV